MGIPRAVGTTVSIQIEARQQPGVGPQGKVVGISQRLGQGGKGHVVAVPIHILEGKNVWRCGLDHGDG